MYALQLKIKENEIMTKKIVDLRYLHEITSNQLNDEQILQGFIEYYIAQSRNLNDLKNDLVYRLDKTSFCYSTEQYLAAYENVKRVFEEYLKSQFHIFDSFIRLD